MLTKRESKKALALFARTSRLLLSYGDSLGLDNHRFIGLGHCPTCLLRAIASTFTDEEEMAIRFKSSGMTLQNGQWGFHDKA